MKKPFLFLLIVGSFFALGSAARGVNLSQIEFPELGFVADVNTEAITVYFNPKEYTVTKSTPWKHHNIQGLDAPTLEFTSGEPYRCQFELFFDRYEEGKSVREITDKIEKLALQHSEQHRPPALLVSWGGSNWRCVLLHAETEIVDSLPDGTPVAAVVRTLWSEFVPPDAGAPEKPELVRGGIQLPDGTTVPVQVNGNGIELLRLVKPPGLILGEEVRVHPVTGLTPRVRFSTADSSRLRMQLVVDPLPGESLAETLARLEKATLIDPKTLQPPQLTMQITGLGFKCILESFSLRFTLFLDDGTPVRAVMNTVWKEFSPAEEQLKGNPRH